MENKLDTNILISQHKAAVATREMCLGTIEETKIENDKSAAIIANFAIASRACLDLAEALEAILLNEGVHYADGKYYYEIPDVENNAGSDYDQDARKVNK